MHGFASGRYLHTGQPVNPAAPLNAGLYTWLKALRAGPYFGGGRFLDLGWKNHGTLNSSPLWHGVSHEGGDGSLYCTGGSNFSVDFPAVGGSDDFALSYWLYPVTWPGGFTVTTDQTGREWSVFFNSSGDISFLDAPAMWTGIGTGIGGLTAGSWWHLLFTRKGGTAKFFVNGIEKGSGSNTKSATARTVNFGSNSSGGGSNADARFDDIRFYNLRGFDATDAPQLYRASLLGHRHELNYWSRLIVGTAAAPSGNRRRRVILGAAA
jgi:hypothetical protein